MKPSVEAAAAALETLASAIVGSYNDDRTMDTMWGWNGPPLTRHEVADIPLALAARLRALPDASVTDEIEQALARIPPRVTKLQADSIPNLPSANAIHVVPQIFELVQWAERQLPQELPSKVTVDWKEAQEKKLLPPALLRRLRGIESNLKSMEPRSANLGDQIAAIEAANAAAENLPTDLATLEEARVAVQEAKTSAETAQTESEAALTAILDLKAKAEAHEKEAAKLVLQCGEAYRVTTTKGLAASFQQRAFALNVTVVLWVIGLMIALAMGGALAWARLDAIQGLILDDAGAGELWVHVALGVLTVGGPIWFAWVATKQIGQRFRLAEDYGFKASVAKAYEGYRREAARIDPAFEARLFGSALTRLEEEPLRLVEKDSYGSPWHELVASPAFGKALGLYPDLRETYSGLFPSAAMAAAALANALEEPAKRTRRPRSKADASEEVSS